MLSHEEAHNSWQARFLASTLFNRKACFR